MKKDRKSKFKRFIQAVKENIEYQPEVYEHKYILENNKFVLCRIRSYCCHGHLLNGRDLSSGRQWCKRCVKINQKKQREW